MGRKHLWKQLWFPGLPPRYGEMYVEGINFPVLCLYPQNQKTTKNSTELFLNENQIYPYLLSQNQHLQLMSAVFFTISFSREFVTIDS